MSWLSKKKYMSGLRKLAKDLVEDRHRDDSYDTIVL